MTSAPDRGEPGGDFRDEFGTASVRRRVLEAWAASPARFREDANAEEDHALGGYRDRLVVELAQNAADAAARAAVVGRLLLRHDGKVLLAANTGAPLERAGVEALSTLRASAKRDGEAVGRFGVGFAAVLAVTDEPAIRSTTGAVTWSRRRTVQAVSGVPSLAEELARRRGHVPVLRLPFPGLPDAPADVPQGYATAVVLPFRDEAAAALADRLLAEVDDPLLLALPALSEVVIERPGSTQTLRDVDRRWFVVRRSGTLDAEAVADRPTEERARRAWSLTWAARRDGAPPPRTLHAPTPTDEPSGLPALLVATFPLDPSRRHVAAGPLRDAMVRHAARAYPALVTQVAGLAATPGSSVSPGHALALVPGPVPVGALDAALRAAIVAELARTPMLAAATADPSSPVRAPSLATAEGADEVGPGATDAQARPWLRPVDAIVVDGLAPEAVRALAATVPGMVDPGWIARGEKLDALGVRRVPLADLVDALAGLRLPAAGWRRVYDAFQACGPAARDSLGALPVPLADGRVVRGARDLLLPHDDLGAPAAALGWRVVDPDAVHPLLETLGARRAEPRAVLDDRRVREAVLGAWDEDDERMAVVSDAVLVLVAAARPRPGELPWLAELALRDEEGAFAPARGLVLPGSPLHGLLDGVGEPDPALVDRWGAGTLAAAGVLATFTVERADEVALDESCDHDLDDEDGYVEELRTRAGDGELPPVLGELIAVRDLDLVRPDRWADALGVLAADRDTRQALLAPARVRRADGRVVEGPSYTSWWLRRHARWGGRRPGDVRLPSADALLEGLWDPAPSGDVPPEVDSEVLTAAGVRTTLDALLAEPGGPDAVLDRLARPQRPVSRAQLRRIYVALAGVEPSRVTPPRMLRVPAGDRTRVLPAESVWVLDEPQWLQVRFLAVLAVPLRLSSELADVLDLPVTSERRLDPLVGGRVVPVPEVVRMVLPAAPATWIEHDTLTVDGTAVEWWVDAASVVHACTVDGLARALAWAAGAWGARHATAAVLADPGQVETVLAEGELDG
ncbi:MAG: molecular chaperone Hsp90 [Actinomycetota bacterium]|nr:molecular chaperone Hsp90 [Actinomycetota bacterium]